MKIPLTQGYFATVDRKDYPELSKYNWTFMPSTAKNGRSFGYAYRKVKKKSILMHRVITGAKRGEMVDHKNGYGLDNRRSNLRTCTPQQNAFHSKKKRGNSRYKGVHWCSTNERWVAKIRTGSSRLCLGYFSDEDEAGAAYKAAANKYHKEFQFVS